jgi:hypothetical protein
VYYFIMHIDYLENSFRLKFSTSFVKHILNFFKFHHVGLLFLEDG